MRRVARAARRAARAGATAGATLLLLVGCTTMIDGTALPVGPGPGATPAPTGTPTGTPDAGSDPGSEAEQGKPPAEGPRGMLLADVLPDECLLDAEAFTLLLGEQAGPPAAGDLGLGGDQGRSCITRTVASPPTPIGAVNVYEVRDVQPVDHLLASPPGPGRRSLPGVGDFALVVDASRGQALQIAKGRYLISIIALRTRPSDAEWANAGVAALSRLPG